ncbi:MAG: two-component regulator propeller domain-containing protein, partial [Bacteroidota bacterium]
MGIVLLLLLGPILHGIGQVYHSNSRKIGQQDGLAHYRVLSLLPDADGMWIGTQDGLNFFDGYEWQSWTQTAGDFSDHQVNFLLKDQSGYIWIFYTGDIQEHNQVFSIDILSPGRDTLSSVEEKLGASLPFAVDALVQFFGDNQNRLHFFADETLWCYGKTGQFELVNIPAGFVPQHRLPD